MTEENLTDVPKITTIESKKKEKDPKRVAAGKRLAEFNRQKKKKARMEVVSSSAGIEESKISYGLIIGILSAILVIIIAKSLYQIKEKKPTAKLLEKKETVPVEEPKSSSVSLSNLDTL